MSLREDETWLNMNSHPPTCKCAKCTKDVKRIKYPYPAELECPSCGHISVYYSEQSAKYVCVNSNCHSEGKTLKEISDKKAQINNLLKDLWNQLQ
jgi:hypothetical protein